MPKENPVYVCIEALGGAARVSRLLGCTRQSVHNWIQAGKVTRSDYCLILAEKWRGEDEQEREVATTLWYARRLAGLV